MGSTGIAVQEEQPLCLISGSYKIQLRSTGSARELKHCIVVGLMLNLDAQKLHIPLGGLLNQGDWNFKCGNGLYEWVRQAVFTPFL
ncbi:hypothetical protein D3C81_2041470 [compost metagenome]